MRGRVLSIVVALAIVVAVLMSLREEERFAVENLHVEQAPGGARVAGTLVSRGDAAAAVRVELSIVEQGARGLAEKETIELHDLGAGARVAFAGTPRPGTIETYSVRIDQGRNPYGN